MASTTARATCTLPGHGSSRHEARDRPRWPDSGRQQATSPGPPPASAPRQLGQDHRTGVRVTDGSRSSRVDIGRTRYSRSQPHAESRPDRGKEYLLDAPSGTATLTRRPDAALPHRPAGRNAISDNVANRTLVRAKMRVVVIDKHSRQEMKKAS